MVTGQRSHERDGYLLQHRFTRICLLKDACQGATLEQRWRKCSDAKTARRRLRSVSKEAQHVGELAIASTLELERKGKRGAD